ncbi:MAG TPA: hypothetical protein PK303_07745 [bacterium]|nr:hypothetical protein [bacterium]HPP08994.1 hypothetical protein [bacterium]
MENEIKFSAGYQLLEQDRLFLDIVRKYKHKIDEVYFPWLNIPSGRGPIAERTGYVNWEAQKQIEYEIKQIKKLGIKLNLLLNASCWGGFSLSTNLSNMVLSIVEYLSGEIGIDSITAFSPLVAYTIKKNFPEIEIRASVNMKISSITAMEQLSDIFDSFMMQKEFNRNFEKIQTLKKWCDRNGKKLSILVNSGCMNFCAVQTFHDNVIAHELEVFSKANVVEDIPGNCWSYYQKSKNWKNLIINHSWVRPEDIHYYKGIFPVMKLATRINPDPEKVIRAYCTEKFNDNLLDLFEPSHTRLLFPYIIDNSRFPETWFKTILSCDRNCTKCDYCEKIFKVVFKKTEI